MALEDFMEPEVGVAVAVTAAVASPQVRNVLRRGAVYGLAGLLMAGDAVSSLAQGVKRGAQKAASEASEAASPEILNADGQTASPESPVAAGKYASVTAEEPVAESAVSADEKTETAPAGHKRTRKAAEAADNG